MSRKLYYDFINKYNIEDILQDIPELSYTKKYSIISDLQLEYNYSVINMALADYKVNYVDLNRVEIQKLKNILVYYCKKYKKLLG